MSERPRCYDCKRFISYEAALKNWELIQAPGVMDPEPYEVVRCDKCWKEARS